MRIVYALLCVAGALFPLVQLLPWLAQHGFDLPLFWQQATSARVSAFAWADVAVAGVAVLLFCISEGTQLGMRRLWAPMLGLLVGPSLALPLFLLMRERHLARLRSIPAAHGRTDTPVA